MLLWNSYKYFVSYASLENWEQKTEFDKEPGSLDRWILTRLDETVLEMDKNLSAYQIPKSVAMLKKFYFRSFHLVYSPFARSSWAKCSRSS